MKDRTDDEMGTLLSDVMGTHAGDVEPDRARQLARTTAPQARLWPLATAAAAAAAVLLVAVPAYISRETPVVPTVAGSPSPTSTPAVTPNPLPSHAPGYAAQETSENRALAEAAARETLAKVPLPAGSERLAAQPDGWPEGGVGLGPSDGTLNHEAWWSVPLSRAEAATFLTNHSPVGMRHPVGEDPIGTGPVDIWYAEYDPVASTNTSAYTGPTLLIQFTQVGDHTVFRANTFLAARIGVADDHRITDDITAIVIERIGRAQGASSNAPNHELPTVRLTPSEDAEAISRLANEFNALQGSTSAGGMSCPAPRQPTPRTTITFVTRSADGEPGKVVADLYGTCFSQVQVSLNGTELDGSLDPGDWETLVIETANAR